MLDEKLAAIRAMAKARLPAEAQALMQRDVDDLRASGILDRVVKVGAPAPDFTLPDTEGVAVSLVALLARGPVVLSFFRGRCDRTATQSWWLCTTSSRRWRKRGRPWSRSLHRCS